MKDFKVVGIISSPRHNGNTATLVREGLRGAESEGACVREVFLPKCNVNFCTGCFRCLTDGECYFADDFKKIRDLLYGADGILLGSPTYCGTYNALMKNCFERLGMFEVMTSSLGGKYIAGISAAGSATAARKTAREMVSLVSTGVFRRGYISGVFGVGFPKGKAASEDSMALMRAYNVGKTLSRDIINGNRYPGQKLLARLLNSIIVKPQFVKYILKEKECDTKAVYASLVQRGLL